MAESAFARFAAGSRGEIADFQCGVEMILRRAGHLHFLAVIANVVFATIGMGRKLTIHGATEVLDARLAIRADGERRRTSACEGPIGIHAGAFAIIHFRVALVNILASLSIFGLFKSSLAVVFLATSRLRPIADSLGSAKMKSIWTRFLCACTIAVLTNDEFAAVVGIGHQVAQVADVGL